MSAWIACTERMPESREHVLVFDATIYGVQAGIRVRNNNFETLDATKLGNVTHWMPLPAPPQVSK